MEDLIFVGSIAYLYSYAQRNGVTPLIAFGLFTVILPYVGQKIFVALGARRTPWERDDYRSSWLGVYLACAAFLCYCAYLRSSEFDWFCFLWVTRTMTVNGGYLMRLVIPLPGPDGQMRPPALPNFIDLYLQQLEQILSHRRVRERLGVGVHPTAPQSASDSE